MKKFFSFHWPAILIFLFYWFLISYPDSIDFIHAYHVGSVSEDADIAVICGCVVGFLWSCFFVYVKKWFLYFTDKQPSDQEAK